MRAGDALFYPAFSALLPELPTGERLSRANALDQLSRTVALRLVGPVLGGALVAGIGAGSVRRRLVRRLAGRAGLHPPPHLAAQLGARNGTRMEMRMTLETREDMERIVDVGTVEGLKHAVSQMDGLLAA